MRHGIVGLPLRQFCFPRLYFLATHSEQIPTLLCPLAHPMLRKSKQTRQKHPCILVLIFLTEFINDGHVWVTLNNMYSKLVLTPDDPRDHFVTVITGASLKGVLCPEIFVSESIFPCRYLWNTKSICKELQCQMKLLKSWMSSRF